MESAGTTTTCSQCSCEVMTTQLEGYRCMDCFGIPRLCKTCAVAVHTREPFHRLQVSLSIEFLSLLTYVNRQCWSGTYWKKSSLDSLGLKVYFGHGGLPCRSPGRTDVITVLHSNGFHRLNAVFCGCSVCDKGIMTQNQLLHMQLFPATTEAPKSAFTFAVLDLLHHLSTQGKVSVYNFHQCMQHLTDNAELDGWTVRLFQLLNITRLNGLILTETIR
jgi:hypothetical protein